MLNRRQEKERSRKLGQLASAACLCAGLLSSGCGLQTMQEEQYTLSALLTDVVSNHQQRDQVVQSMATILINAKAVEDEAIKEWESARKSVQMIAAKVNTEQSNPLLKDLDSRLRNLKITEDTIVTAASQALAVGSVRFASGELQRLGRLIEEDRKAIAQIKVSKMKYLVNVRSYNEVIGLFPTSVTARMLGEEQRIGFSADDQPTSGQATPDAGKLVEVAIGKPGHQHK